jgi:hypothetical protein
MAAEDAGAPAGELNAASHAVAAALAAQADPGNLVRTQHPCGGIGALPVSDMK